MDNTQPKDKDSKQPEPKPLPRLPDPAICRARHSGVGDLVDCLVDNPTGCKYALNFGHHFYCNHPEKEKIISQTEAASRKGPADGKI